jgi:lipid-binding SYLF domain-containing protein
MSMFKSCGTALALLAVSLFCVTGHAQTREDARLITATQVLEEMRAQPDQNVPNWLMERAYGVAVIPEVIKGAMIFGGRHGNGVMTVRDGAGRFSDPVFLSLTGGSVGWQFGAQATDVVLVFATRRSVENFARGKFTLGGSASVAAGPLGRSGEAAAGKDAEIYSYSRSRGLFAGVALDGSVLRFEKSTNRNFYGRPITADEIFSGKVVNSTSQSARRFIAAIASAVPAGSAGAAAGQAGAATPSTTPLIAPTSTAPAAPVSGGAQSFPLEDNKPGGEPH